MSAQSTEPRQDDAGRATLAYLLAQAESLCEALYDEQYVKAGAHAFALVDRLRGEVYK